MTAHIVMLLTTVLPVCSAQEPQVQCGVDRARVYEGESIIYEVFVRNVESPPEPELSGFEGFRVRLLGAIPQNSRSVTIINGRRSEDNRFGTVFRYRLQPAEAGEFVLPAPSVEVDGTTYRGNSVDVSVIPPTDQEIVLLEVSADRDSVYRLQPFTVTLKLLVRQLPGEYADISPLSVQRQARRPNAAITVPWLAEQLNDDVTSDQPLGDIVNPIITSSSDGIYLNDLAADTGFLLSRRKAVFQPRSRVVKKRLKDGTSASFVEYTIRRRFQATRESRIEFSPTAVKGVFAESVTDGGSLNAMEVFAVSNTLTVDVKSPPAADRPDSFTGGIGQFELTAALSPDNASVGDPLTLTLTVSGRGTVDDIRPPEIERVAGLAEQFRIYRPSEKTLPGGKVFTYSLRAKTADVEQFPAVPFAFFDVDRESYQVTRSEPIPVTIRDAEQLESNQIVATSPQDSASALTRNESGLFANYPSVSSTAPLRWLPRDWLLLWGGMSSVSALLAVTLRRRKKLQSNPQRQRRRQAHSRALGTLTAAGDRSSKQRFEDMARAVTGLVADFTGQSPDGLTPGDIGLCLAQRGVSSQLQQDTVRFLQECDAARFGAESAGDAQTTHCRALLEQLSRELDQ
ncbi:MAG: BatD family protein [Planctomycetaceae bacterium]|nr:BatD family protein [Planctomycetaceae bacterium]